jgi:hypothetical protein
MKELWIEAVDHTVNGEFDAVVRTKQSSPTDIHVVEYSAYQEELKLRLDLEDLLATANEHVKIKDKKVDELRKKIALQEEIMDGLRARL